MQAVHRVAAQIGMGGNVLAYARAILSILGARSLAAAAAFLCNVLVARQLGDAHFSQFYLLFSIMTVVAGVTGPSIDTSLVRFAVKHISPEQDRSLPYFKAVLYFKLCMLLVIALACIALTRPLLQTLFAYDVHADYNIRYYYVFVAFAGGGVVSMWGFAQAYFQAHQKFTHYAGYEFCSSLLRLGLIIGLMGAGIAHVLPYMGVYVLAPLAMCVMAWSQLPGAIFRAGTSWSVLRELYDFGKWVFIATVFTIVAQRMDIVMLNFDIFAVPKSSVGHYSAAMSIVLAGELVLLTFLAVLLPKASALHTAEELREFIGKFRLPSLVFCLGLGFSILLAGPFVRIALGEEYAGTEQFYGILILGVMVSICCVPPVCALYSLGASKALALIEGIRLLLIIVLGYLVIPGYGVWGMACVAAGVRALCSSAAYIYAHQLVRRQMHRE